MNRFAARRVAVSLPSTRVDALAPSLLEQIRRVRKTGFTLAPEAGSQRMRDIIQKEYQEEELIEAARQIFGLGWRTLKLYFMIGLPGETEDDILGIADLAAKVAAAGGRGRARSRRASRPSCPSRTRPSSGRRRSTSPRPRRASRCCAASSAGAASASSGTTRAHPISRASSRAATAGSSALLLAAYRLGCRFDGWTEHCRFDLWEQALAETGIEPLAYLRRRYLDETLPWDHLGCGVTKEFLQRELAYAVEGRLTPDCSIERCTYCGACDFTAVKNVTYHVHGRQGQRAPRRGDRQLGAGHGRRAARIREAGSRAAGTRSGRNWG